MRKYAIALGAILTPLFACAAGGVDYLDQMQQMDLQVNYLKKQKELNDLIKASSSGATTRLPQIVSVYGSGEDMVADVIYENGLRRNIKKGELAAKGATVTKITQNGVVVSVPVGKKKVETVELDFAVRSSTARQVAHGVANVPAPLPHLPPIPNGSSFVPTAR